MVTPLTRVEVSLSALRHNIAQFKTIVSSGTGILPIVKANAYGHGIRIAKEVEDLVSGFGVVNVAEGIELRNIGIKKRILVLAPALEAAEFLVAQEAGLELAIFNNNHLARLSALLPPLKVHIKLNTGLNRLGVLPENFAELIEQIRSHQTVVIQGLFSHLADAENPASLQTIDQLHVFQETIEKFPELTTSLDKHIAATAATLLFPHSHYQLVRIGIGLYGVWPSKETEESWKSLFPNRLFSLQPALSYRSTISCIQNVVPGSLIGYGGTYRTRRNSRIATIPVGYYEGLPRSLNNKGIVVIHDRRTPIVGNICMNMAMVDISDIPEAQLGSTVTIIGSEETQSIEADELAKLANTLPYELFTNIPAHIPRVYIQ